VLAARAFAQRVRRDQRLQLRDQLVACSARKIRLDAFLQAAEAQFLEASALGCREGL